MGRGKKPSSPTEALLKLLDEPLTTTEQIADLFREIYQFKNDRGAGIIMATYVEDALQAALSNVLHIRDKQKKLLFGINAPLSGFANKARFAFALDIIGPQTYSNLDHIRNIRNAFAHSKVSISFETKQIKDICALFEMPENISNITTPKSGNSSREIFTKVSFVTAHNLSRGNLLTDPSIITLRSDQWSLFNLKMKKPVPIRTGYVAQMKRQSLP